MPKMLSPIPSPALKQQIIDALRSKEYSIAEIATMCGIGVFTVEKIAKEAKIWNGCSWNRMAIGQS